MPKFGAKKCLICVFLRKNFKKPLSYLKSEPSNLSNCKVLRRNKNAYIWDKKSLIWVFSTKNLGSFLAGIWQKYCYTWNQHSQICLNVKYPGKTKMPKFGNKNALFGYFWAGIFKNLLSYLKSAPSNLSKMSL